ncbi:hypothetical protein EBH_0083880 [Eimeria brunetti]|uniref:Secreted protein n=1 Tax=Eimeria brunetti TaxID=51314 RepID=U6LGV3_9EIME|nr:hypothetical protein EBH_0083880 [Eimeria brunetti]
MAAACQTLLWLLTLLWRYNSALAWTGRSLRADTDVDVDADGDLEFQCGKKSEFALVLPCHNLVLTGTGCFHAAIGVCGAECGIGNSVSTMEAVAETTRRLVPDAQLFWLPVGLGMMAFCSSADNGSTKGVGVPS